MKQHIAVVGAGMAGLCTALALARQGNRVTVFERDVPPPDGGANEAFFGWKRRGAAQFRHPHAFLGLMCSILEENYPDLVESFWEVGARKVTFEDMIPPEMLHQYSPAPGDEKMWILMCRRATMETVLRRYVESREHIEIVNSRIVSGLLIETESQRASVKGLRISARGEEDRDFAADVVVDASGRSSKFSQWLLDVGASVETESEDAEIVYYTRHYKLLPGVGEPARHEGERSAGDLGYLKFGVFPGEEGHFAVIICLPVGETRLRDAVKSGETFDEIARTIPGLLRWVADDKAEATTASFGFADIHAVWKHYVVDDRPSALNFFAVGDSAVRTNPLYGRGCSTGILHAHVLADILAKEDDPVQRAIIFDQQTEAELRPIYKASLREDKRGIRQARAIITGRESDEPDSFGASFKKWIGLAVGEAIGAAAREQLHVLRGAMRTFNLLEKPGDFMKDWKIRLTILRYLLRGRKRNAQRRLQPGLGREELLAMLDRLDGEKRDAA